MEKKAKLKDGSEVIIRSMREDDMGRSFEFFRSLPEEDRAYLRVDVTKRELMERRIHDDLESDKVIRLIALVGTQIVADGSLELESPGWESHLAELRLVVARPFQRSGLGMALARELYLLAVSKKVEQIVVKVMRPQVPARGIFKRLGFQQDAVLTEYVKDISGKKQDLIVMRCDLEDMWRELEDYFTYSDWQRRR